MSERLYVNIGFDITTSKFITDTNTNNPKKIVGEFLRSQIGKGVDNTKANDLVVYNISIYLNLSDDSFTCTDNCGNKGLREGILMTYIKENN